MERRPLMMEEKSDENSGALALNETVGENCFLAGTTPRPVYRDGQFYWWRKPKKPYESALDEYMKGCVFSNLTVPNYFPLIFTRYFPRRSIQLHINKCRYLYFCSVRSKVKYNERLLADDMAGTS